MAVETLAQRERQHSQYVDFWNGVLVPNSFDGGTSSSMG